MIGDRRQTRLGGLFTSRSGWEDPGSLLPSPTVNKSPIIGGSCWSRTPSPSPFQLSHFAVVDLSPHSPNPSVCVCSSGLKFQPLNRNNKISLPKLGPNQYPPPLLVKQGCGQSRTSISLRFSQPRRDGNGNVDSISIVQAGPYGSAGAVIQSAAEWLNRVNKLLCILRCVQLICSESDKHGLIQCVDPEQPRPSPRKERSQPRDHGHGRTGKLGKCWVNI